MFDIAIDRTQQRVVMRITAFPDIATIRRKESEITSGITDILHIAAHFDLLVSLKGLGPVSRDVGEHMDAMLGRIIAKGLRKSANVGFGAIAKMQLQRLTGNDDRFQFFATIEEAQAWLNG